MNKLSRAKRVQVVSCLIEGCSIRATVRMTGVSKNTVTKLLCDLGSLCIDWHDENVHDLECKRIQAYEIWSFCYAKDRNVPERMRDQPGIGSIWTWTAIDADSKFMVSWLCGDRDAEYAKVFMHDVASRLANRVQLTTDGFKAYLVAVPEAVANDIDFAVIREIYGNGPDLKSTAVRYSPPKRFECERIEINERPDRKHINTSYVERANLSMRMQIGRFTRLTNAFSKKYENLCCAVSLHMMHYDFCRKNQALGTSPAVACGLADHVWSIVELIGLLENQEQAAIETGAMKRGTYRKKAFDSK